jgi:hypothetical protein
MEVTAHFIICSFLDGPDLDQVLGTISPFVDFLISFILFVGIKEKLIFLKLKLWFLLVGQDNKIAAVIWIDLMGVRVVGDGVKLKLIDLTTLLWEDAGWEVV